MDITSFIRNNKIEIIENLMDIGLKKDLFKKYCVTTKTGLINTIIMSENNYYVQSLENYFDYTSDFLDNSSNLIIDIAEEFYKESYKITNQVGEIIFGKGNYGESIYKYKDLCIIKHKSSGYIEIKACDRKNFKESIFLISKVIESCIVEQHIVLGYLPIHGNLIKNDEYLNLIIGDSQSGKTYYSEKNENYSLISDEIFLMSSSSIQTIIPYKKEYVSIYHEKNTEKFNQINRKISKINNFNNTNYNVNRLNKIVLIRPHNSESICKIISQEEKEIILNDYLLKYPLHNFIEVTVSKGLVLNVLNILNNTPMYIHYRKEELNV